MTSKTVEFFFDIGSPYSYLASTQIDDVVKRCRAEVKWRPFLLGGVFKATGNVPPATYAAKAAYLLTDLQRWSALYGVPFKLSSRFPLNTLRTERALFAAEQVGGYEAMKRYAKALFSAYWVNDEDVSNDAVLARVAGESGLSGEQVVKLLDDGSVKEALRTTTEEAVKRGAFGAPTLFLGDQMYFGNDRLALLEHALTT